MNLKKTFTLQITPFIICFHRIVYNDRLRGHPFQLPVYETNLHKKSFIVRTLYEYIKWKVVFSLFIAHLVFLLLLTCFICFSPLYMCTIVSFFMFFWICVCRILINITNLLTHWKLTDSPKFRSKRLCSVNGELFRWSCANNFNLVAYATYQSYGVPSVAVFLRIPELSH